MDDSLVSWRHFFNGLPNLPNLRHVIFESWERSRAAGVDAAANPLRRVSEEELQQRIAENEELLLIAAPHLEWLSTFLNSIPHVVYMTDADGIVLHAVGNSLDLEELGLLPGYDWSEAAMGTNGAGTALRTGRPVAVVGPEHFLEAYHDCTCTGAPIHDASGRVIGAVDISTPVAHGDPERLVLTAHLAFVVERTLRYQEEVHKVGSLEILSRLSSFMAHELNNPLHGLELILSLLAQRNLDGATRRLVENGLQLTTEAGQIVRELRLLGGDHAAHLEEADLNAFLKAFAASLALPELYELEVAVDSASLNVLCHTNLLERALHNLVQNAVEAMPGGGYIGIRAQAQEEAVRISVLDDGPGVPPELCAELLHRPLTTKGNGSGLGLLLAKAIVEKVHAGSLLYAPNKPQGSQFHIDIPRRGRRVSSNSEAA